MVYVRWRMNVLTCFSSELWECWTEKSSDKELELIMLRYRDVDVDKDK